MPPRVGQINSDEAESVPEKELSPEERIAGAIHYLRSLAVAALELSEDQAFDLLGQISDGCEDVFGQVNDVTEKIEMAREPQPTNEPPIIDAAVEPSAESISNHRVVPPTQQTYEVKPVAQVSKETGEQTDYSLLDNPDEFLEKVIGLMGELGRPLRNGFIARQLFGVDILSDDRFNTVKKLLEEAASNHQAIRHIDGRGYWPSDAADPPADQPNHRQRRITRSNLEVLIKSAGIGTVSNRKPKQRGRGHR